jgi:2-polyprenyl-6-methoxyphenol hydroxylase-like FAD-dependent oxidoreductase
VLALPQNALEELLQRALAQHAQVKVNWRHRADLRVQGSTVTAAINNLGEAHREWTVDTAPQTRAAFLIGADGHDSLVRQRLGIDYERIEAAQVFAVYEFESEVQSCHEMRVVLGDKTTDVFWPLSKNRCRWSFQLNQTERFVEFPRKDRTTLRLEEKSTNEQLRKQARQFLQNRAPWFEGAVKQIYWFTLVQFEHRLARRFGVGNCWLAGDAAHQTSPVGMQSMNVGLNEAAELAQALTRILRENAPRNLLDSYERAAREQWQLLLGMNGVLRAKDDADPWIKQHYARLPPCLPASGEPLKHLLDQLGLETGDLTLSVEGQ